MRRSVDSSLSHAASLRLVAEGHAWFQSRGGRIHRAGRDLPGSNWHFYPFDPDGHINELYYGIEQIGWDGLSKPHAIHAIKYREPPALPHISEQAELLRNRLTSDLQLSERLEVAEAERASFQRRTSPPPKVACDCLGISTGMHILTCPLCPPH